MHDLGRLIDGSGIAKQVLICHSKELAQVDVYHSGAPGKAKTLDTIVSASTSCTLITYVPYQLMAHRPTHLVMGQYFSFFMSRFTTVAGVSVYEVVER